MNIMILILKIPRKIFQVIIYQYEYLYYRFFYPKLKLKIDFRPRRYLLFGGQFLDNAAEQYHMLFPGRIKLKTVEADLICEHSFNLLGSGYKNLSAAGDGYQTIDWHNDFKSGYSWQPDIFYRNIRFGHVEGVDVKVPWELSRFQHLSILGQAYILTGNRKYPEEAANQISDWIKNNPVGFGVNWRCTMDVAIRAVNWLVAMEYFAKDNSFPNNFLNKFYNSIYEHGKFVRKHLEYTGRWTTNHYLSNITGLFFISVYCPLFHESKEWKEFALSELHKEIEKQVYEDGCTFESSSSYHRLALELFFYPALLGKRSGIEFTKEYKDKLKKMFEFSLYCLKPNGMISQIGDNDSGRFIRFSNRPILDHKYLLSLSSVFFQDSNLKLREFCFDEEAFWIFGENDRESYDKLPFRNEPVQSKSFTNAGWYIIRNRNDYCFISCGPNGGDGWHSHNDKLSFELVIDGQDVIVDPGTYIYTAYPEERNKFRSTEYHNTIKFDGYEQNEIPENSIFSLPDRVKIINAELLENDENIIFQGEIQYAGITHRRTITLNKKTSDWQIIDNFSCPHTMNAKLSFHLSPDITSDGKYLFRKNNHKNIGSIDVEGYELAKDEYDYSSEYGTKSKAECLTANISFTKNIQIVNTIIYKT